MNTNTMKHLIELDTLDIKKKLPGVSISFFQTENCTVCYTEMKAGVEDPWHNHPFEVIGIILEGSFEMEVGDKTAIYKPGVVSYIPAHEMHRVIALSDCKVVTFMYPKQEMN